jgi:hypothetical protein
MGSIIGMNEIFVSGGNDSIIGTGIIGGMFIHNKNDKDSSEFKEGRFRIIRGGIISENSLCYAFAKLLEYTISNCDAESRTDICLELYFICLKYKESEERIKMLTHLISRINSMLTKEEKKLFAEMVKTS